MDDKESYLADEELLLVDSGEIPEVAYHAAIYFLSTDPEGPSLALNEADRARLKHQVVARYRTIILRDLDPRNRDKRIYRGVARCKANWERLQKFCSRHGLPSEPLRHEVARALHAFLEQEVADVTAGRRSSSINCCHPTLRMLAKGLKLDPDTLPAGWQALCLPPQE